MASRSPAYAPRACPRRAQRCPPATAQHGQDRAAPGKLKLSSCYSMDSVCAVAAALDDGLQTMFAPEELYLCSNNDPDDDDAAAVFATGT